MAVLGPIVQAFVGAMCKSGRDLAVEFESVFVSMLLNQMRQSLSGEGLFPGDSSDTLGGLFDMMMGRHISQVGGLGLADSLEKYLAAQAIA